MLELKLNHSMVLLVRAWGLKAENVCLLQYKSHGLLCINEHGVIVIEYVLLDFSISLTLMLRLMLRLSGDEVLWGRIGCVSLWCLCNRHDGQRCPVQISFIHTGCEPSAWVQGQSYLQPVLTHPIRKCRTQRNHMDTMR